MLTLDAINSEIESVIAHGNNRADIAFLSDLFSCRDAMMERSAELARAEPIEAEGSEFAACVNGRCFSEILPFLEELLATLKVVQPRLYDAFLRKFREP